MAESTARQFIIAALIFTAVITGAFSIISMTIPSGAGNFTDYNRTYNEFADIKETSDTMSDSIKDAKPSEGVEGILSGLYATGFGAVKQIWTSITTMTTVLNDFSTGGTPIDMPTWFTGLMISIILIVVSFAIIASWMKWQV